MKKILAALALALTVGAAPCLAQCGNGLSCGGSCSKTCTFSFGFKWHAFLKCGDCGSGCGYGGGGSMGPWYSYWPLEAHFQTPAPTGFPYWPAPMTYHAAAPAPDMGNAYAGAPMGTEGYGYGNAALAIMKGVAAASTGSAAMLAETSMSR